jgi:hypothetical protein
MGLGEDLGGSHDPGLPSAQCAPDDRVLSVTADLRLLMMTRYQPVRCKQPGAHASVSAVPRGGRLSGHSEPVLRRRVPARTLQPGCAAAQRHCRRWRSLSARRYDLIWVGKLTCCAQHLMVSTQAHSRRLRACRLRVSSAPQAGEQLGAHGLEPALDLPFACLGARRAGHESGRGRAWRTPGSGAASGNWPHCRRRGAGAAPGAGSPA